MSTQKLRRNFRNTKNNKEHKLKQKKDELQAQEAKLEKLHLEFNSCLKELSDYEQTNIFSREDDCAIANYFIENQILDTVLNDYEKVINEQKENYCLLQEKFGSICGDINENAINLNNILTDIEIFYGDLNTDFTNEEKFRNKLNEKLNKVNEEMKILSPLIFGKNIESVTDIAIQLSHIYSAIELEKKQYSKIKKELKKHGHHTLTHSTKGDTDTPGQYWDNESKVNDFSDSNDNSEETEHRTDNGSKYKMTDLKEIETEIKKLRKTKSDTMRKLIDSVYGKSRGGVKNGDLKELKLKQVMLHYNDSIIDDSMLSLKLESELLQIQCEEFQNQLVLLEKKREINKAKQAQLINCSYTDESEKNETKTSKQTSREALAEVHKLQRLEREQRNAIHKCDEEILKINKGIKAEKDKQKILKNNIFSQKLKQRKISDKKREKSLNLEFAKDESDSENKPKIEDLQCEIEKYKSERLALQSEFNTNKALLEEKTQNITNLDRDIEESISQKSELQKMSHTYQNSIVSHKYLSENAVRKNSKSLEFISDLKFLNKEYDIKMDQINNKYREKQTFLKNKFVTNYNSKMKKDTKNRQAMIEQESYNIIRERNDTKLTHLTATMNDEQNELTSQFITQYSNESEKFSNKTKAVKIKFGSKVISSVDGNECGDNAYENVNNILKNDVLRPISFEWNDSCSNGYSNDNKSSADIEHSINGGSDGLQSSEDISTDLSFDNVGNDNEESKEDKVTDYKHVLLQLDRNDIDIYNILYGQMHLESKNDECENENEMESKEECDIEKEYLKFENVDFMNELLTNWTSLLQSRKYC